MSHNRKLLEALEKNFRSMKISREGILSTSVVSVYEELLCKRPISVQSILLDPPKVIYVTHLLNTIDAIRHSSEKISHIKSQ